MKIHLLGWGIVRDYNPWFHHGECVDGHVINNEESESQPYTSEDDLNNT